MALRLLAARGGEQPRGVEARRAVRQLGRWLSSGLVERAQQADDAVAARTTLGRQLREMAASDPVVMELGWKIAPATSFSGPLAYEDFLVEFADGEEGVFATTSRALGSEASGCFHLPWPLEQLPEVLEQIAATVASETEGGSRHARTAPDDVRGEEVDLEQVGRRLFAALFKGDLGRHYDRAMATASAGGDSSGLRLKLSFDLRKPSHRILDQLPWELLWDDTPLALDESLPLSRYLQLVRSPTPQHVPGPLRVLVVESAGLGDTLDFEGEHRRIDEAWAAVNARHIDIDVLREPSASVMARRLAAKPYDVLHFMGHGSVDGAHGHGSLHLADGRLMEKESSGRLLMDIFRQQRSLRLMVINACQSSGFDPLAQVGKGGFGVAQELVKAGCRAVVGMRLKISDLAALSFAEGFYEALADGLPVDVAVVKGRHRLRFDDEGSLEWATPVTYLRSRDGYLFGR